MCAHSIHALIKRQRGRVKDVVPSRPGFATKIFSPIHHSRVRKIWLPAFCTKSARSNSIIAVDQNNTGILNSGQLEPFLDTSESHLSFE